ncbi:MAG: pilus assembly protein [Acidimicrobiales bacterium]
MSPAVVARGDRGVGTIGTAAAFVVFLLLMFTAVQVLFNLYATSMVTAAAHDAAREVASFDSASDRCGAAIDAEAAFRDHLGAYAETGRARLEWTCASADVVRVRVVATHPSILPARLGGLLSLSELDRTIEVRVEDDR